MSTTDQRLVISEHLPTDADLADLAARAKTLRKSIDSDHSELRLPFIVEFSGSPKSGKSTIIGIVSHFFKRCGFRVGQPAEGASLRTPPDLKDDLLAFNAWSACYALQQILEDCHAGDPDQIVMLDRGLFDAVAWFYFLHGQFGRVTEEERDRIVSFLLVDLWRKREGIVFLFTADHATSLAREGDCKLISSPGRAMNAEFLNSLIQSYESVASKHAGEFTSLWRLDTSFVGGHSPKFQSVAYAVARRIVETMEQVATQMLLITSPSNLQGFVTSGDEVDLELRRAVDTPRFMPRTDAEASSAVQQLVPYALLKNAAGKYLVLRRRASGERPELAGKYTMLVGGHAEEKDWDDAQPESVFERCLRREIEEELIGLNVGAVRRLGVINDVRNRIGSRHLAVLHEVDAGGSAAVRRQTADKEFGRETVEWRSPEEIAKDVRAFDPWSQLVAAKLFGAALPEEHLGPTLFVR